MIFGRLQKESKEFASLKVNTVVLFHVNEMPLKVSKHSFICSIDTVDSFHRYVELCVA